MPASSPSTILVVCTANVCRSPMAEKLLQHALAAEPEPLRSLKVASAGIAAGRGQRATDHSVTALKKVGLDLANHASRRITQELLDEALVVFGMTETHRAMIELNFERPPQHVYLFRQFVDEGRDAEIPDPYGLDLRAYEACRDSMVEAIPGIVKFLRKLVAEQPAA